MGVALFLFEGDVGIVLSVFWVQRRDLFAISDNAEDSESALFGVLI